MEPTCPYWKALEYWLTEHWVDVAGVNTQRTKQAKCLDGNSPAKNDPKDALATARLVKDGRCFWPHLPQGVYAGLRVAPSARAGIIGRLTQ
jgi:hypothetical protein